MKGEKVDGAQWCMGPSNPSGNMCKVVVNLQLSPDCNKLWALLGQRWGAGDYLVVKLLVKVNFGFWMFPACSPEWGRGYLIHLELQFNPLCQPDPMLKD